MRKVLAWSGLAALVALFSLFSVTSAGAVSLPKAHAAAAPDGALTVGTNAPNCGLPNEPACTTVPTTAPSNNSGSGTIVIPGSVSFQACGFQPGSKITITVGDPVDYGTGTADANGCFTVTVTSRTLNGCGGQGQISLNGGPWVNVQRGVNQIFLTGIGSNGGPRTFTYNLNVVNTCTTAVVTPSEAFTGADIAVTVIGGLLLIGVGAVILVAINRRRSNRQAV